jgi:hypothetical protein
MLKLDSKERNPQTQKIIVKMSAAAIATKSEHKTEDNSQPHAFVRTECSQEASLSPKEIEEIRKESVVETNRSENGSIDPCDLVKLGSIPFDKSSSTEIESNHLVARPWKCEEKNDRNNMKTEKHEQQQEEKNKNQSAPLIPPDIRRILKEVASTGSCSWLPWIDDGHQKSDFISAPISGRYLSMHRHQMTTHGRHHGLLREGNKRARTSSRSRKHPGNPHKFHRNPASIYSGSGTSTTTITTMTNIGNQLAKATTSAVAGVVVGASSMQSRQSYHNGLHLRSTTTSSSSGRKRPLFLIRTTSSASSNSIYTPGSVGSGRTSGSEPEDTSQYECDSEGTSATSNSELSLEQGRAASTLALQKRHGIAFGTSSKPATTQMWKASPPPSNYKCLKDVFKSALDLVLDYFYKHRGGYKLSPTEKRWNAVAKKESSVTGGNLEPNTLEFKPVMSHDRDLLASETNGGVICASIESGKNIDDDKKFETTEEANFHQRKHRLINLLGPSRAGASLKAPSSVSRSLIAEFDNAPPFTIQRIAEVLLTPERYYTQTHKLCNCLEKLLLVKSSAGAFGGSTGGDTSQSRREETELAALADEKGRLRSEFRLNKLRARQKGESILVDDAGNPNAQDHHHPHEHATKNDTSPGKDIDIGRTCTGRETHNERSVNLYEDSREGQGDLSGPDDEKSRELLENARASLRIKFDHVGIDPHSSAAVNSREARALVENRGMTNSPPPPAHVPGIALPTGHASLLRPHGSPTSPKDKARLALRVHSPLMFHESGSIEGGSPPMGSLRANPANIHLLQMHHAASVAGEGSAFDLMGLHSHNGSSSLLAAPHGLSVKDMDFETRSPASSDVDSESDVSFDDSASDRSDGSDYEPLTAARTMALNRLQQQRQNRVLTSLQQHGNGDSFRQTTETEYPNGDSIESAKAEDSGGSDSSSSDMAD